MQSRAVRRLGQVTGNRRRDVSSMPESVFGPDVCERQIVNDFLIGLGLRGTGGQHGESRRCRIAAEHRMRPVHARINDRYVHPLSFISFVEIIEWGEFLVLAVNLRRADVRHAVVQIRGQLFV